MTTKKPISHASTAVLRGSLPALQRAAQRARERAVQTGTKLVISRDGVIQRIELSTSVAEVQVREDREQYKDAP